MNLAEGRAQTTQGNASEVQGGAAEQSTDGIGTGVEGPVSEPSGAAGSESPLSGQLNPTTIYQLDPDNPGSKLTGAQIRESLIRAGQFDQTQSQLHKAQAELEQSAGRMAAVEEELEGMKRQQAIADQLKSLGLKPQAAPVSQETNENWLYENDQTKPTAAPQADPNEVARKIDALVEQSIQQRLGDVDGRVDKRTAEQFERQNQERQYRDQVSRTHQALRSVRADKLRGAYGLDERRISEILDMEDTSRVLARQAEDDYQKGTQEGVDAAREKLLQSSSLLDSASEQRAVARVEFDKQIAQNEAAEALESQSFARMPQREDDGRKPESLKPEDIAKFNAGTLEGAHKDVDKTALLREQLGPRSP